MLISFVLLIKQFSKLNSQKFEDSIALLSMKKFAREKPRRGVFS